jgi:hypothetical protein
MGTELVPFRQRQIDAFAASDMNGTQTRRCMAWNCGSRRHAAVQGFAEMRYRGWRNRIRRAMFATPSVARLRIAPISLEKGKAARPIETG